MFKVTAEPKFTHTVKVMVPVDGGHKEQSFKATFKVLPVEELTAEDHSEDQAAGQIAVLRKAIISLDELVGDDDQPLPYSDELRDQLLGITYVRIALLRTYLTAITKAKSGN